MLDLRPTDGSSDLPNLREATSIGPSVLVSDLTTQSLAQALRGLDAQRQAHEQNIANIETPGYKAQVVDFSSSLRRAMRNDDVAQAEVEWSTSQLPTRLDGNNVRLDDEVTSLTQNQLHQQLVTQALNARYRLLRTSWER